MRINLTEFKGANLATTPRKLLDGVGVAALNLKHGRSDLRPWAVPLTVATVPTASQRKTLYRMGRDVPNDASYWLSWTTVVDCIRSFNPTDTTERTIFTGSGTPKWTDNTIGLASAPYPTATRELGVPAPTTQHTVSINTDGATGTAEDVYVIVTFVNAKGEEGSNGPVSTKVTVKPGAVLDVGALPSAPAGSYDITARRIYATKVGATTLNYYLAAQVPIATSSTTINLAALNDAFITGDFDMPPADGHSLVELWNKMAAMISGKAVYLCEAGYVYAWPIKYRMPIGDTPIGQATFDQNLLVLTTGRPYIITGQTPDSMSSSPINLEQACVSKQSIVSFGFAVVWASPDGLWAMSSAGPKNLTEGLLTIDDWKALKPDTIIGVRHNGLYFGFYNDGASKGFVIDPNNPAGITFLEAGYNAAFMDPIIDSLYVLAVGNVQKWDAGASKMTATFKSKVHRMTEPKLFKAAQVVADSFGTVTLKVYADGVLKFTKTVTDDKPFRLPQGYQAKDWQFEIATTTPIVGVVVAESIEELDG